MNTDTTISEARQVEQAGPVTPGERIHSLGTLRGIAVPGILPMNISSFSMTGSACSNPTPWGGASAGGTGGRMAVVPGVREVILFISPLRLRRHRFGPLARPWRSQTCWIPQTFTIV